MFYRIAQGGLLLVALVTTLLCGYVLSVLWRVSREEFILFGRSDLIPFSLHQPKFTAPPTVGSYGDRTYLFSQKGKEVDVYEQQINSFQHVYGSALVSHELGENFADYLFRANEYFEAIFWRNSGTTEFYQDTKKDLANNAVGRGIGRLAVESQVSNQDSTQAIVNSVLAAMADGRVYLHFRDPRVKNIPSLKQFGCPFLSQIQQFRSLRFNQSLE